MTINKTIAAAIATGSLLLNAFATTAFADTITVTGNGALSSNTVTTTDNSSTTVTQSNNALVTNTVHSSADTGNNAANYNTGGNVGVSTGNATTNTQVSTAVNLNQANIDCGCDNNGNTVTISGNGASSGNHVVATDTNNSGTQLFQNNHAMVSNKVGSDANTGNNDANYNTGGQSGTGNVTISTGAANTGVSVSTMANGNVASVGNGTGAGAGVGSSAIISGNGALSNNSIVLDGANSAMVVQGNDAFVTNHVWTGAFSGKNDANYNTGGDVTVMTGAANTAVGVDNKVNFNAASLDCGCFTNGDLLKLVDNGANSYNSITDTNGGGLELFQGGEHGVGNMAMLMNDVSGKGGTGMNDAGYNTGAVIGIDPTTVMTGSSSSWTGVSNAGNVNLFGNGLTLPGNVSLGFDLGAIFGGFGL